MRKFLLFTLAILGLLAVAPNESRAQDFSITFGGGPAYYGPYYSGYSYYPGYGYYYYNRPYYHRYYRYPGYYGHYYRRYHRWHHWDDEDD